MGASTSSSPSSFNNNITETSICTETISKTKTSTKAPIRSISKNEDTSHHVNSFLASRSNVNDGDDNDDNTDLTYRLDFSFRHKYNEEERIFFLITPDRIKTIKAYAVVEQLSFRKGIEIPEGGQYPYWKWNGIQEHKNGTVVVVQLPSISVARLRSIILRVQLC